jgi:hypothetical protein
MRGELLDAFNQNLDRVESLIQLFDIAKANTGRPNTRGRYGVKEADILRSAVVFLHSALEDYLRGVIIAYCPWREKSSLLKKIPLLSLTTPSKNAEKFFLDSLTPFEDYTISSLITESITQHMSVTSFNTCEEIVAWMSSIDVDVKGHSCLPTVATMIGRRHKIVHETDKSDKIGRGNHWITSISKPTVQSWVENVKQLVVFIDDKLLSIDASRSPVTNP